jgi:hypothetical protein
MRARLRCVDRRHDPAGWCGEAVDPARFTRHAPGDRWFVDETYIKVGGIWRYVYRAIDQQGQVIDVLVSARRDAQAARRFFHRALTVLKVTPHRGGHRRRAGLPGRAQRADPVGLASRRAARQQSDRGRSQPTQAPAPSDARATDRPHRPSDHHRHAFVQNLRRGHYELGLDATPGLRIAAAFSELA